MILGNLDQESRSAFMHAGRSDADKNFLPISASDPKNQIWTSLLSSHPTAWHSGIHSRLEHMGLEGEREGESAGEREGGNREAVQT